jgi:hypothetical protein
VPVCAHHATTPYVATAHGHDGGGSLQGSALRSMQRRVDG